MIKEKMVRWGEHLFFINKGYWMCVYCHRSAKAGEVEFRFSWRCD